MLYESGFSFPSHIIVLSSKQILDFYDTFSRSLIYAIFTWPRELKCFPVSWCKYIIITQYFYLYCVTLNSIWVGKKIHTFRFFLNRKSQYNLSVYCSIIPPDTHCASYNIKLLLIIHFLVEYSSFMCYLNYLF